MTKIIVITLIFSIQIFNASEACEKIISKWGPFDYSNPLYHKPTSISPEGKIRLVTKYHFSRDVQNLTRKGDITGDLHYTLREIPNHPMALDTASKYEYKMLHDKLFSKGRQKLPVKVDCYFERAERLYPKDSIVFLVNGIHLHRFGEYKKAVEQYKKALKLQPKSAETHYNIGLSYYKLGLYDEAEKHAKIASDLNYPLKGLQRLLNKAKKEK